MLRPLMRASSADGWTVEFTCADGPFAAALRDEGFHHRGAPMARSASPVRQLWAAASLAVSLRRDPPDLIHTHTPAGGLVGRLAAMVVPRVPVVHTFHGLPFESALLRPVERAFLETERVLARRTTYFFSQAAGDARRAVELGIARADRMLVIGNGVDIERFRPDHDGRRAERARLGIPGDEVLVLTVARLVREKGLLDLADATLRLADLGVHVALAGTALPSDRTSVETELGAHPVAGALGQRWKRLGHVTGVDALLRAADVFVLPTYREGLPRSVIEAMASGVPVIATDIPACRELVDDGVTGLLVPPGTPERLADAIRALATDPLRRSLMGERARAIAVERFDERRVLDMQLAVFRRLVAP